jgi:phosphatidylglycerophosphate synthase
MRKVPSIRELRPICQTAESAAHDSWLAKYLWRKISIIFTKLLLYTPITANQVTLLWFVIEIVGSTLFIFNIYAYSIIGAILLFLSHILDGTDGEVARYRKSGSLKGAYLDFVFHNIASPYIFVGLAFGLFAGSHDYRILVVGFSAALFLILIWLLEMQKSQILSKNQNRSKEIGMIDTLVERNARDNPTSTSLKILTFLRGKIVVDITSEDLLFTLILLGAIFHILQVILIVFGVLIPLRWVIQAIFNFKYSFRKT